jgi:hypothetical protein
MAIVDAKLFQEVEEPAKNGLCNHHISIQELHKRDQIWDLETIICAEIQMELTLSGAIPQTLKRDGSIVIQSRMQSLPKEDTLISSVTM